MKEKGMGRKKSKGKGKGREMLFQFCFVGRLAETGIFLNLTYTFSRKINFFFFPRLWTLTNDRDLVDIFVS